MKVLWVCNIMLPMIAEYLHLEASNKEGWLDGLASIVLARARENGIRLGIAFPASQSMRFQIPMDNGGHADDGQAEDAADSGLACYGFLEDANHPDVYDAALEAEMCRITEDFAPDIVHCFGTEYPHTLALCRIFPRKDRILVGIQGICSECAKVYLGDLPQAVKDGATFRDMLKNDSLRRQQQKFKRRGEMEIEAVRLAGNITGRTAWDRDFAKEQNPAAPYFSMNETLRGCFYEGRWEEDQCIPHSIFVSQGDYPIKGFHYMLQALPAVLERYPDTKVYVAGNSLVKYRTLKEKLKISAYGNYLRSLIGRYGLEEHVVFLGRLNAGQMKERYLKSHLFMCCSTIENSPNSLGEAMLLGMPCIAADVGGISSVFTDGEDGILYKGYRNHNASPDGVGLPGQAALLAESILKMWEDGERMSSYCENARNHARRTHDGVANYRRLTEIYTEIVANKGNGISQKSPKLVFVSNYINHHQIPFCNAMQRLLGEDFAFIQTEVLEEERRRMGWQEEAPGYVHFFYREPELCRQQIAGCSVALFGGCDDESYIAARLKAGKPVIRYQERLYKSGQWKAISPRGLFKKYHDHTRYRSRAVYLLCAGAYVPSDYAIIRAYPGKMLKWGYFPETRHYDVDQLMAGKRPGHILWAARFLDWKHPELPLRTAKWLKEKGYHFHMDIIGGGEMERRVKELMAEYDLSSCVTLQGYRAPDEVRAFMERADIFLMTSDRKEGWGAVANEAMNSGCAVVGGHMAGAVPFLIRHRENGLIFQDGKEAQLFSLVEELLQDRELCGRLGRNAVQTIVGEWNAEHAAARLLDLCGQLGFWRRDNGASADAGQASALLLPTSGPGSPAPVIAERRMYRLLMEQSKAPR